MNRIYIINGVDRTPIAGLIAGRLRNTLDNDNTLTLTLFGADAMGVGGGTLLECEGNYYDVVTVERYMVGNKIYADVVAESVLFRASLSEYNYKKQYGHNAESILGSFNWWSLTESSTAMPFLVFALGSTDAPDKPPGEVLSLYAQNGESRRSVLNRIAERFATEIEVSGYTLNFWLHRGSVASKDLIGGYNVKSVRSVTDFRAGLVSYDIEISRKMDLSVGDNVHIEFAPLGINVDTRITAMEYNPYDKREITITVGDYRPDIRDLLIKQPEVEE